MDPRVIVTVVILVPLLMAYGPPPDLYVQQRPKLLSTQPTGDTDNIISLKTEIRLLKQHLKDQESKYEKKLMEQIRKVVELSVEKEAVNGALAKVVLRSMISDLEDEYRFGANETAAKLLGMRPREYHWRFILVNCTTKPKVKAMLDALKKKPNYSHPQSEYEAAESIADVFKPASRYIHVDLAKEAGKLKIVLSFDADPLYKAVIEVIEPAYKTERMVVLDTSELNE